MQYANHIGYSDVNPFEIIRKVSEKTVEIRAMNAERDPNWKPDFVAGGFCGTVVNQRDQRWIISSSADAPVVRIRLGSRAGRMPTVAASNSLMSRSSFTTTTSNH
jgi:hypothetical protein